MLLRIAVIDDHDSYRERLVTTLSNNYADKLEVSSFSSIESFDVSLAGRAPVDIMLVSANLGSEQLDGRNGSMVIYLVDDRSIESLYDRPAICRYQKVDLIYKELIDDSLDRFDAVTFRGEAIEGAAVITFFPACGGAGSSTLAAACALGAVRRGLRVFYLNLERYGQASTYFDADGFGSLTDVLCAIMSKKRNASMRIQSMTKRTEEGVCFVDSCRNPLDLADLTPDYTTQLLHSIASSSPYDVIIVDADYANSPIAPRLMELSTRSVFVSNGTQVSNGKYVGVIEALRARSTRGSLLVGLDGSVLAYNNYVEGVSSRIVGDDLMVMGVIEHMDCVSPIRLVDALSVSPVIDELLHVELVEEEGER